MSIASGPGMQSPGSRGRGHEYQSRRVADGWLALIPRLAVWHPRTSPLTTAVGCGSLGVRRSRCCAPSVTASARSPSIWAGRHRRSRGSGAAMRPHGAASCSSPRSSRNGTGTGELPGRRQRGWPLAGGCASTCRTVCPGVIRAETGGSPAAAGRSNHRRHGPRYLAPPTCLDRSAVTVSSNRR